MSLAPNRTRFRVRTATSEDAAGLAALQKAIYDEARWFVGDGPPSVEALTRRLRSLEPKMSLYLVATDSAAGEVTAWLELNRLAATKMQHVAVLTLAVAAASRRQGRRRNPNERGRTLGVARRRAEISLNVRANNEAAVKLYERSGFAMEGRERAHIRLEHGFEDNLIMSKFLRNPNGE